MGRVVAYCGLICSGCPAHIATQAGDEAAKERVAARWREEFNAPEIDASYITCDGCLASDGRLSGYCRECAIRACGIARSIPNCAHCPDYAG